MIPSLDYKIPTTLQEACQLLGEAKGGAKIIAGGTDLVIGLRSGDLRPHCLIDVTALPELQGIEERDGMISVGAAVTHGELASSPLLKQHGKALSDAASELGSPQIRNLGTIGGNIVNASPAADTLPPLMVFEATASIASREGEREVPLIHLFKDPYESNLRPFEILVRISFPKLPAGVRSGFIRLARREAMAIARMSMAIVFEMDREGEVIEDIRISAGAVTPRPLRMSEAEAFLKGKRNDPDRLKKASEKISETMIRQSGIRPSTSYKKPVVEALFLRTMKKVLEER